MAERTSRSRSRRRTSRSAVEAIRIEDSEIGIETDEAMGKVSIVGAGMRSHPGVAAKVFRVLGENKINIEMISTSPIKISCVIRADQVPRGRQGAARRVRARGGRDPEGGADRHRAPPDGFRLTGPAAPYSLRMAQNGEYRVGVVGATGAVGSTILEVLAERKFPAAEVRPLASARSAGSKVPFAGSELEVQELTDDSIQGLDLVLSSAGGKVSSEWAPKWIDAGAVVVDNTSYWRMHEDVPLVVAGVNDDAAADHNGLVANPNCTTMQLMVALKPILDAAGVERLIVSTYQSVSGTGRNAIKELRDESEGGAAGQADRDAAGVPAPGRLQRAAAGRELQGRRRLHDRGAQGDGRDAQDPRPLRGRRDLGDLCRACRWSQATPSR